MGDAGRIRQILSILILNAIKFTEHGHITATISAAETTPQHVTLQFRVQDSGIGITPEKLASLFAPPAAPEMDAPRRFGRATGKSLYLAQTIARRLGSALHITSQPNVGSDASFLLTLPVAAPIAQELPATAEHDSLWQQARVLVVEDHPMNRAMLEKMLQLLGVGHVLTASNGKEALAALAQQSHDLIFMDCQMPVMDGFEATLAIKHSPMHHHTPVVGITADTIRSDIAKCFAAGMDDYCTKPLHVQRLRQLLHRWLKVNAAAA